jgi:glutathione peroxidase
MHKWDGTVRLFVNVASHCGFTDETIDELVALDKKYSPHGLTTMAFPCDQFGKQAGSVEEIRKLMKKKKINFNVFGHVDVNGEGANEIFTWLKSKSLGEVSWNFEKFLVGHDGEVIGRWDSNARRSEYERAIRNAIAAKSRAEKEEL